MDRSERIIEIENGFNVYLNKTNDSDIEKAQFMLEIAMIIETSLLWEIPSDSIRADRVLIVELALEWVTDLLMDVPEPIIAHVAHDGFVDTLALEVDDLEELIARVGWTVCNDLENVSPAAKREIDRLGDLEFTESRRPGREWYQLRLVKREYVGITPDM